MTTLTSMFQVGQWVKVKGELSKSGFLAHAVKIKQKEENSVIEGAVQRIDPDNNLIRLLNKDFTITADVRFKSPIYGLMPISQLSRGSVVKLIGVYEEGKEFKVVKGKFRPTEELEYEEIQGCIEEIDSASNRIVVTGIDIMINEMTVVKGPK